MKNNAFVEWLIDEKNLTRRSAQDVCSRQKRIEKMMEINAFNENTIDLLIKNEQYQKLTSCIKSQLKRTIFFVLEYQEKNNG